MIGWENPQRTVCPSLVVGRGWKSQRWQSGNRRVPSSQHTGMFFFCFFLIICEFSFQFQIVPVTFSHLCFKFKQTIRWDLWGTLSPPFPSLLIRPEVPFISNSNDKTGGTTPCKWQIQQLTFMMRMLNFSVVAACWNDATLKCYWGDPRGSFGMLSLYHPTLKQGDLSRTSASAGAWGPNYTPDVWK